jgi:hypothetical protein
LNLTWSRATPLASTQAGQPVRHRDQARPTTYQNLIHPDKEHTDAPNRERPTAPPTTPRLGSMIDSTETLFFSR